MKCMILILVLATVLSCNKQNHIPKFEVPDYEIMADRITKNTARKLKKEKNLNLIGIGGGMMNNIRMMSMSFVYKQEIDIESGRDLLISSVNEYLNDVNSSEELRPHLTNYPFKPKDIEIWIFIHNPDNSLMEDGKICFVSSIDGTFKYIINKKPNVSETIYEETYEEALLRQGINSNQ